MRIQGSDLFVSLFLGIGLGLGYMTELRFMGPVGVSEVIILAVLILLLGRYWEGVLVYPRSLEGILKLYMLASAFFVLPLVTATVYYLSQYKQSDPIYIISFQMGVLLLFLMLEAVRNGGVNLSKLALGFAVAFCSTNIFYIVFMPASESVRISSYSSNPNQLVFYLSSLTLMLAMYNRKVFYFSFPFLFFIGFRSGSDAYLLAVLVSLLSWFGVSIFNNRSFSFGLYLFLVCAAACIVSVFFLVSYQKQIFSLWAAADEGGGRLGLMANGLLASIESPFFGLGAGSFSGVHRPFDGKEAHNTFIDFSMQFGFIFSIILYFLMFFAAIKALRFRDGLSFGFIVGFIISGLFHFSGRHFVFWIEMSIFWFYSFSSFMGKGKD